MKKPVTVAVTTDICDALDQHAAQLDRSRSWGVEHEIKNMLAKGAACYVNKAQPAEELWFAVQQVRRSGDKPGA